MKYKIINKGLYIYKQMSEDCSVSEIHRSIYLPILCISNYLSMKKVALRDYMHTVRIASNCPYK
jgi:hypothetical protein